MKKQFTRKLLPCLFILGLTPISSFADCLSSTTVGLVHISLGTVEIPSTAPVGSVIKTASATVDNEEDIQIECNGGGHWYFWANDETSVYGPPVAGLPEVYSTNISGIGFRVVSQTGKYLFNNPPGVVEDTSTGKQPYEFGLGGVYKIELIKTSTNPGSGSFTAGQVADVKDDNGTEFMKIYITGGSISSE